MNKKLYRDEYHKVLGGVCSGLAEYFEMDVTIVRLLFAFTVIIMGVGIVPYIVLWIVVPKKDYKFNNYNDPTVDYTVPPQQPGQFNVPPQPNNPYDSGNPFRGNPVENMPPRQKSNAGIIIGLVLIVIGGAILVQEYNLIPDFDFGRLWPAVLVLVGGALIVSGQQKRPWDNHDWTKPGDSSNDNPPAADDNTTAK
jgi:phage shock protein C